MAQLEDNRTRYELLFDRRRALRELERLAARLSERDDYDPISVEGVLGEVKQGLSSGAGQASCAVLLQDVRAIYRGLVELSRLWAGQPATTTRARSGA